MEALIRLRDTDGKLISPAEFIPLAEQTGLISSVTWFVVEDGCRILKNNPDFSDVSVSINMPQTQLLEKGFIPRFTGIVDQAGIDHNRICIEFTEREMLENFEQTLVIMEELTQDGFRFFLDDFGVSYSNFNCLLQLPFRVIKLDPCLVNRGKDGRADYTTLHTLTNLFHSMDLTVIAEGAENEEEVQQLTNQGVDRIQGFALARPMPVEKLVEFYRTI
jgi:EAL domain-containing protein (putative c-di-GMP-specific phosphodiesterase class I)